MSDLIVACVNVQNYEGRGWEYVNKLWAGVDRHLKMPHHFVCVTDDLQPVVRPGLWQRLAEPIPKGWWQKLALFKPGVLPPGRVLYFDLDTVITGDLMPLAEPREFSMLTDFILGTPSSAIMAWPEGFGADIWAEYERQGFPQRFAKDQFGTTGGDQDWLHRYAPEPKRLQDTVDGLYASWDIERTMNNALPADARAVSFWKPKRPHQSNGWVQREWRL